MFRFKSSLPEASKRPDIDQLQGVSVTNDHGEVGGLPECVDASMMASKLINNVKIVRPRPVSIDTSNARVLAGTTELAPHEAVVQGVPHLEKMLLICGAAWKTPRMPSKLAKQSVKMVDSSLEVQPAPLVIRSLVRQSCIAYTIINTGGLSALVESYRCFFCRRFLHADLKLVKLG